ncbi:3-oxoacyl-ACP synthase [Chlorogloeopsis fritschii PCC 6912]|uniref:3-oxoacyl-ACP synthase n=1 Tax=Chlorogloeopsis fritschii PCC 6912 TaxID=211165 RepID=A0A3S0Y4A9_CHLFR|nr:beta-ketoacyl-ACP synthase [Chlorogloeopsis fritschii]RUR76244.1 3-oxoacyl-ACP synthase [Chlorogloeopsis fritschii PCC 6912]
MVEVVVTGISLISALGKSPEDNWQKLIAGKTGIQIHQPFPELNLRPLGLIGKQPAQVKKLTSWLVTSALKDAGLVPPLPDCAVVIGSSRSHQAAWEKMARQMYEEGGRGGERENLSKIFPLSPCRRTLCSTEGTSARKCPPLVPLSSSFPVSFENWLDTLPHMNAIAAARQIGATGIVLAPMAACATGIWAIAQAVELIKTGQVARVLVGAVEAAITPLTITGFEQMGALASTGAYPFDVHREGLVLGEGGALFVLESAELARRRQAKVYAQILGFGLTADAFHPNAPEPTGKSAIAAIKQSLERSNLTVNNIDYIHAHGTATQMNDRIESLVIQRLFPQGVAVSSTKGATGHTLGASGALGVAFSLMALQQQILPPTVGLREPEFDLDLVREAREAEIRQVLCLSFGFGGQNGAIALGLSTKELMNGIVLP